MTTLMGFLSITIYFLSLLLNIVKQLLFHVFLVLHMQLSGYKKHGVWENTHEQAIYNCELCLRKFWCKTVIYMMEKRFSEIFQFLLFPFNFQDKFPQQSNPVRGTIFSRLGSVWQLDANVAVDLKSNEMSVYCTDVLICEMLPFSKCYKHVILAS